MSRFESSRFTRNALVINPDVIKKTCDKLGWSYHVKDDVLTVTNAKQTSNLWGEYALKLDMATNKVTYNTYYMPDAKEKVEELQKCFYEINAVYSREALIQEFQKKGFTYKSDFRFIPSDTEAFQFYMEGISEDLDEDEPIAKIKFTILTDGTIITNSDYLPNDVNERAHEAMDLLEELLGNKRIMTKKTVPARYLSKMKPRRTTELQIKHQ